MDSVGGAEYSLASTASAPMALLATLFGFIAILPVVDGDHRARIYYIFLLIL